MVISPDASYKSRKKIYFFLILHLILGKLRNSMWKSSLLQNLEAKNLMERGGVEETHPVSLGLKVNNILTIFLLLYILLSSSECFVMFERLLLAKSLSVTSEMHEWKSSFAEISLLWTFNVEVTVGEESIPQGREPSKSLNPKGLT